MTMALPASHQPTASRSASAYAGYVYYPAGRAETG